MDARATQVADIMQTEIATLAPDERIDLAEDVMHLGRVRHMPVVDGGRLVGIVSSRDVLAASLTRVLDFEPTERRAFLHGVEVVEVMTADVVTLAPDATLAAAAELIVRHKIGCIPVVNADGLLVGLVTDTDLIRAALLSEGDRDEKEVESMADLEAVLKEELEALRRVRDELRVQAHLGKAEAAELWESLEKKWHEAEERVRRVSREAEEPMQEIGSAARELLKEIRDGYKQIRDAL